MCHDITAAKPFDDKKTTVVDLLTTEFFRPGRENEILGALYCGLGERPADFITADPRRLTEKSFFVWSGALPGVEKPACYLMPNPLRSAAARASRDLRRHLGLGDAAVGARCVAMAEIDDLPLTEQAERLAWLERETGLRASVLGLSGDTRPASLAAAGVRPEDAEPGKSIHAFWSLQATTEKSFARIQRLLVVLLRSDPAITNASRLMRMPGVVGRLFGEKAGRARIQTCLRAEAVSFEADDFIARLEALAQREGVADVDAAFAAIRKADALRKLSLKAERATTAEALRSLGERIKARRAILPEDAAQAATLGAERAVSVREDSRSGGGRSPRETRDFSLVPHREGGSLLAWIQAHVPPGTAHVRIGSPWEARAAGDPWEDAKSAVIHHEVSGHVWLYAHKDGTAYHHRAVADATLDGLTGTAYHRALATHAAATAPSLSVAEERRRVVERALEREADAPLLAQREAAECAMRPLRERMEARQREAEAWTPLIAAVRETAQRRLDAGEAETIVEAWREGEIDRLRAGNPLIHAARRVKALGKEFRPLIRAHLKEKGMPRTQDCSWVQGLGCALTHRMAPATRACGSLSCYRCAAQRIATKAAAICAMPQVDATTHTVIAPALEDHAILYETTVPATEVKAWLQRFKRSTEKSVKNNSVLLPPSLESKEGGSSTEPFSTDSLPPAYVIFHHGPTATILSTVEVPASRRTGVGVATPLPGSALRERVLELVRLTYTVAKTAIEGLDGEDFSVEVARPGRPARTHRVVGRVTSSEGRCLDPQAIYAAAAPSPWVEERPRLRALPECERLLREMTVPIERAAPATEDDGGVLITAPVWDGARREAVWAALEDPDAPAPASSKTLPAPVPSPEALEATLDEAIPPLRWPEIAVEMSASPAAVAGCLAPPQIEALTRWLEAC